MDEPIFHLPIKERLESQIVQNLQTLAEGLLKVPASRFDMSNFVSARGHGGFYAKPINLDKAMVENECGTTACAAGHAFAMGIGNTKANNWEKYISKNLTNGDHLVFEWCFGGDWTYIDNTPLGASKRILYMLKFGIPNQTDTDVSELTLKAECQTLDNEFYQAEIYQKMDVKDLKD